jgi:hypothetical protein
MTEILVGTRKGLFALQGRPGSEFDLASRAFVGDVVEFAMRDPRSGRYFASVTSPFYGPKIWWADDLGSEWQQSQGPELPENSDSKLERIWTIEPAEDDDHLYAGGDPGVLFESRDGGMTWTINRGLWEQPTRNKWSPGNGGLCLHSIATWPGDPDRISVGISAVGCWHTEDGGLTWEWAARGLYPRYAPEDVRETTMDLCVHNMHRAPLRPERLFMQFHGGVYRSDDSGRSWTSIAEGLPSDFGFPMVIDPADPESAYVIPLSEDDRTTGGRARVYETRDAGASWKERGDGLPQNDAYLGVLRQAFDNDGEGESMGLYFGSTSGEVYGSGDAGASWFEVANHLPLVASVRVA